MIALVMLLAAVAAPAPKTRLAVMDVKPGAGASPQLAAAITDAVVMETRRQAPKFAVISTDEIRGLLTLEKQRQQLGCDATACLAEIGGALGASQALSGTLTRFGDVYVVALKRVEVNRARVVSEASERFSVGNEAEVPDMVGRLVRQLFKPAEVVGGAAPAPDLFAAEEAPVVQRSHTLGWSLVATSVACAVVAAVGWGFVGGYASEVNAVKTGNPNQVTAQMLYGGLAGANVWSGVAIGATAAAALAAGGAVLAW